MMSYKQSTGLLFRTVHVVVFIVGENAGFQSVFFIGVWFKIDKQVTVRFACSIGIRFYYMLRFTRIHLPRQVRYLRLVSYIFIEDYILGVQRDVSCFLSSVKYILCYENHAGVCVMTHSCKEF